jgi:hypothetical protein
MFGSSDGRRGALQGKRIYRKRVIGTVCQYSDADSARKAVTGLLAEINSNDLPRGPLPMTVAEVCDHFDQRELTKDNTWRSYSTKKTFKAYLKRWIIPQWGALDLSRVRTIEVESWLRRLPMAKSSCAKIRGLLSVLFNHACRYELFDRNPIRLVRQGAKRKVAPSVLTPTEIKALLGGLNLRERTLVLLAASTGLRQSELFGVKWCDIDFAQHTMNVVRSIVYGVVGPCKTESSQKPVPVHPTVLEALDNGDNSGATTNQTTGYLQADATVVGSQSGVRRSCVNIFVQPHRGSEFKSDSDGTLSGTHIRPCYVASAQNSK